MIVGLPLAMTYVTYQTFVQSNSLRNSSPVTTTSVIYFRRKQKLAWRIFSLNIGVRWSTISM